MAEFCLDCWNKMNGTDDPPSKYIISKELDLCDGCGKWTNIVIMERKYYYLNKFRFIIYPIKIIFMLLLAICKIPFIPYLIYKRKKNKQQRLLS